ncbi:hypothetical protein BGX30_005354 [Mortierella sp. GBA39]|nr:hypothetical protein BGX30_005354 [Mortierella sp. GBA39]
MSPSTQSASPEVKSSGDAQEADDRRLTEPNSSITKATAKFLQDPKFILLQVEPDNSIQLYSPCDNNAEELEYRCISHLWGDVDDDGCTQEDKPLYLMENIYRYCKECVAMVDCQVDVLEELALKDLKGIARRISSVSVADMADQVDFQNSGLGSSPGSYPLSAASTLAYWSYGCSKSLVEVTIALFESTWFTRIWTLQESVLPSTVVLTHETMGFNGRVDLLSALDLLQELKNYLCRYGYAWSNEFWEDYPSFKYTTSAAMMLGRDGGRRRIDFDESDTENEREYNSENRFSDDSLDDIESVPSDCVRGEDREVHNVEPAWKSEIPDHRDEDEYISDSGFKALYNSIANIIKLRGNADELGIIKVIAGLNRRCKCPSDYFYGVAGLLGLKLHSGLDVRKLFYMFANKLVEMSDDNIVWIQPDWGKMASLEHELYKCIVTTNLKVVKDGTIAPTCIIKIKKLHKASAGSLDSIHQKMRAALIHDDDINLNYGPRFDTAHYEIGVCDM